MRDYTFTCDLGNRGIRTITVKAFGYSHARCKAVDALEAAGFTIKSLQPQIVQVAA